MAPSLPASLRVIVRGWLNCNQLVMLAPRDNVLVDSGYCTHREQTLERLAGPEGLDGEPLERLINTHCHSDHMGGNAAVAHAHGCTITIPAGEAKHVDPWTPQSAWMEVFDQRADPFHFDGTIAAGDTFEGGGFEWQVHAAPGHDMDALMFYAPSPRILISGDALWQNGMGFVWPQEGANPYIDAAHATLTAIETLDPALMIPGHGRPFANVSGSVASVRERLDAFARDPAKNARHVIKVMFVFALLERGRMAVADVPAYLARIPCYRRMSEGFLGRAPESLKDWLVDELARSGVIRVSEEVITPMLVA